MRLALAAMLILFAASAQAGSLATKRCILSAATRLPAIPGLIITEAKGSDIAAKEAAAKLIDTFPDSRSAIAALGPIDDKAMAELIGRPAAWKKTVLEALLPNLSAGVDVAVSVRAAGQDATFGFICVASGAAVVTAPIGLAE